MKRIEYVHQLEEGMKYVILGKGVFTFLKLFYKGNEIDGPDGIFTEESQEPFLWKDLGYIFYEEKKDYDEKDPYFDYEEYIFESIEL